MQIKRYEAASVQEALSHVRKDLGQDAVILSTKKLRRGNTPLVEVTAAREAPGKPGAYAAAPAAPKKTLAPGPVPAEAGAGLQAEIDSLKRVLSDFRAENSLRKDLAELKETVNTLFDFLGLVKAERGCFSSFYHHLIARGISRERAYRLMERIKDEFAEGEGQDQAILDRLEDLIKHSLQAPDQTLGRKRTDRRALAFLGPTGVGKTTTLAKLAAHYALEEKKKVGLITTDTYRIAAAEQLKIYARIMGLPIEVAAEKESLKKAFQKFSDRDLILIDTPGKSQSDEAHIRKMGDLLDQPVPVSTHLLLSLTASRENLVDAALRFALVPYETLIFTKIDECASYGTMFDVIDQVRKPVSYITNGQNVPKDIIQTTPGRIARLIIGSGGSAGSGESGGHRGGPHGDPKTLLN